MEIVVSSQANIAKKKVLMTRWVVGDAGGCIIMEAAGTEQCSQES
jgi:hypothetical protein